MKKVILFFVILLSLNAKSQPQYLGQTREYIIQEHSDWHINQNDTFSIGFDKYGYRSIFVFGDKKILLCKMIYIECPPSFKDTLINSLLSNGFVRDAKVTNDVLYYNDKYLVGIWDKDIYGKPTSEKITVIYN